MVRLLLLALPAAVVRLLLLALLGALLLALGAFCARPFALHLGAAPAHRMSIDVRSDCEVTLGTAAAASAAAAVSPAADLAARPAVDSRSAVVLRFYFFFPNPWPTAAVRAWLDSIVHRLG